jgi:pimeloyl-ACP methyl ester carboxylesterase
VATPTLIVWGDGDRVLDISAADILHQVMPNSQVLIVHDVGHAPMLEAPEAAAQDYLRFRDSNAARPAVATAAPH